VRKNQALIGILLTLSGCTATQLRYETLNESGTVESLTKRQILFNLALFKDDPYAIPSQVTVIAGSASTTNSVSPTFMTPLGTATVITSQLANTSMASVANAVATTASNSVAGAVASGTSNMTTNGTSGMTTGTTGGMTTNTTSTAPAGPGTMSAVTTSNSTAVANGTSTSVANGTTGGLTTTTTNGTTGGTTKTGTTGTSNGLTNSSATTHSNKTLSLTLNDNWTESWTLDPVTDPDVLRRLSALYRYVLGESVVKESEFPDEAVYRQHVEAQFMCEYPINQSPATASAGDPPTVATVTNAQGDVEMVTKTAPDASAKDSDSVTLVFKCRVGASDKLKIRITKVKRSDLKLPNCVICLDEDVGKLKVSLYKSQADEDAAKRLADLVAIIDDAAHAAEAAGAAMKAADAAEAQAKDANVKAAAAPADTDAARSAQADAIAKRAAAVAARAKADTARVNAKTEKVAADAAVETATEPVVKDAPPRPKTITETSRKEITEPAIKVGAETVYIADAGAFSDENILWDGGNDNHNLPYVNPALIFKLITTSKPNNCRPDVCGFGGSGSHSFYGAKTDAMTEPKRAFHDFELFVSAATQVPSASTSGGANKKAVGVSVSPDAFVLR
jgi:hypothetical protein